MKLAISNIAWPAEADAAVFDLIGAAGLTAVEVAPTRLWPDWHVTPADARAYRAELQARGLACSSLQAIVFGKPELKLFGNEATRGALSRHLCAVADLAVALGARPMVFGAPGARDPLGRPAREAFALAVDTFASAGEYCRQRGVVMCIEPNPPAYGCAFVTTSAEGAALVRAVGSPGFGLHLDTAGLLLAGEDPARAIEACAGELAHVHVSEPHLAGFETPVVDHCAVASALRRIGWPGWVALEMRASAEPVASVRTALARLVEWYGD